MVYTGLSGKTVKNFRLKDADNDVGRKPTQQNAQPLRPGDAAIHQDKM